MTFVALALIDGAMIHRKDEEFRSALVEEQFITPGPQIGDGVLKRVAGAIIAQYPLGKIDGRTVSLLVDAQEVALFRSRRRQSRRFDDRDTRRRAFTFGRRRLPGQLHRTEWRNRMGSRRVE